MAKFKLFFILLLTLGSSAKADSGWDCAKLMEVVPNDALANALSHFSEIEDAVIAGAKVPGWNDFESLTALISAFSNYQTNSRINYTLFGYSSQISQLEKLLMDGFHYNPNYTRFTISPDYVPTGYELIRIYRYYLNELNKFFPERAHFVFNELPEPSVTRDQIIEQAKTIVTNQKRRIEKTLVNLDPSLKTWGEFEKRNLDWLKKQAPNSGYQELYNALSNPKKLRFSMRRPENARFWLPKVGFQNQRITGSSRGTFSHSARDAYEGRSLGILEDVYYQLRADLKPNYGYLRFDESVPFDVQQSAANYGEDIYDFDFEKIKDRLTFTIGDSLGNADAIDQLGFGRSMTPIQYLRYSISSWSIESFATDFDAPPSARRLAEMGARSLESISPEASSFGGSYIELQTFGPVSLDYVTRYTFTLNPPSADFLVELQSRGIPIFDGRENPDHPKPWDPALSRRAIPVAKTSKIKPAPLALPLMVDPADVKAFEVTEAKILSVLGDLPSHSIHYNADGFGFVQTDEMKVKGEAYLIQPQNGRSEISILPISTSPVFRETNEFSYLINNSGASKVSINDYISQDYILYSSYLYHEGPVSSTEPSLWSTSFSEFLVKAGKQEHALRRYLKQESEFQVGYFLPNLLRSDQFGGLSFCFYIPQDELDAFVATGAFVSYGGNVVKMLLKTDPTKVGELSDFAPMTASQWVSQIQAAFRKKPQPADPIAAADYSKRSVHLRVEAQLINAIESQEPVKNVRSALKTLEAGPNVIDDYDTDDFRALVQEYIDGKF